MNITEQVKKLIEDMESLIVDLEKADASNIDVKQLKELQKYSRGFSIEISEQIDRIIREQELNKEEDNRKCEICGTKITNLVPHVRIDNKDYCLKCHCKNSNK